jgi:hypothetical protein
VRSLPYCKEIALYGSYLENLIAESYLFGQDSKSFDDDFKKAGPGERRRLWRQRGELGKLHNLVAHITASGKRSELFSKLQVDLNVGVGDKVVGNKVALY